MDTKQKVAVGIAILAFAGLLVAALLLIQSAESASDVEWARRLTVYGSLEALAFAAGGFLFGEEIHRLRAKSAENRLEVVERDRAAAVRNTNEAEARKLDAEARAAALCAAITASQGWADPGRAADILDVARELFPKNFS